MISNHLQELCNIVLSVLAYKDDLLLKCTHVHMFYPVFKGFFRYICTSYFLDKLWTKTIRA